MVTPGTSTWTSDLVVLLVEAEVVLAVRTISRSAPLSVASGIDLFFICEQGLQIGMLK
jgi:hypothetical protein